ncbi:hypothetical protein MTO96_004016 [Rhipicephalus appendiculatus]
MQFRQRAAWVVLFLYLGCGFLCLTPLFQLTNRDTLLRIRVPSGPPAGKFVPSNVSSTVLVVVAILLYVQGFAVLLACTRTDTKSRLVKSMFPFLLCTMWTTLWKKPRSNGGDKLGVEVEPFELPV